MSRTLLLTGRPGVGKTTAVRRVAERLEDRTTAGFVTEEERDGSGRRTGFAAVPIGGGSRVMIASVDREGGPRVGRYGVDVGAIDRLADETLTGDDVDVWLIDEIGKMECLSDRFVEATRRILDGPAPVVATIGRSGGGLIAEAKARDDTVVGEVTEDTRDAVPDRVVAWLDRDQGARGAGPGGGAATSGGGSDPA